MIKNQYIIKNEIKSKTKEGGKLKMKAILESLEALHTHTHNMFSRQQYCAIFTLKRKFNKKNKQSQFCLYVSNTITHINKVGSF